MHGSFQPRCENKKILHIILVTQMLLNYLLVFCLCLFYSEVVYYFSLAENLIGISEERPEPWIAMAHSSSVSNKKTRAVYFAQKV